MGLDPVWLLFPLLGLVAGVLAGLLGIGGGVVLVVALIALLPAIGVAEAAVVHVALATSLASIIITASASANAHRKRGSLLWPSVGWLAPGLVVGGIVGSRWALGVEGDTLATIIGGFCLLMAVRMAWPRPIRPATLEPDPVPRGAWLLLAGTGIGAVSAVVGIGGGSLTVPLLASRGVAMVRAVGTSSACGVLIAIASAAGYALGPAAAAPDPGLPPGSIGFVHLPAALGIGLGAWIAAPWGVRLAHRLSGVVLSRVFALALAVVGVVLL
ncbi:sulfite exporter TauE/SafE family protein [Silanimonas sp.]|uniref:sulfite exporter TauE/SafE family protein n=1 Tax=Silanimonas sp. TaxID=1929290 RepID=UPI0025F6977F|nr:sulfite exporter TauE/SafE family protein [Silanimonas sp.]